MTTPILSAATFRTAHIERDYMLKNYATSARGRDKFDDETVKYLKFSSAFSHNANNANVRIVYAAATFKEIGIALTEVQRAAFVTVALEDHARPHSTAGDFEERDLKSFMAELLDGLDYIGVVEAALFTNFGSPGKRRKIVSWHAHAIVWNTDEHKMTDLAHLVNNNYRPMFDGPLPFHFRFRKAAVVQTRAFYILKAPLNQYRTYAKSEEILDAETGELLRVKSKASQSRKSALNPGDAAHMCKVIGKRTVPMLMFSGGAGNAVMAKVTRVATKRLSDFTIKRQRENNIMRRSLK